jgi:hypothetical protein
LPVPDDVNEDDDREIASPIVPRTHGYPPDPTRIAASLMLSRSVDGRPGLGDKLVSGAPVVVIDVPDATMLDALKGTWRRVLFGSGRRLSDIETDIAGPRDRHDGFYLFRHEPAKLGAKSKLERTALEVLPFALPIIANAQPEPGVAIAANAIW